MLNEIAAFLTLNPYYQLILSILEINMPLIITKVFTFLISFASMWFTLLSFTYKGEQRTGQPGLWLAIL